MYECFVAITCTCTCKNEIKIVTKKKITKLHTKHVLLYRFGDKTGAGNKLVLFMFLILNTKPRVLRIVILSIRL